MHKLRLIILSIISISLSAHCRVSGDNEPCMNISHSEEVGVCMMHTAKKKEDEYTKEYNAYLKSINTTEERPYDKQSLSKLAQEAKKSWDTYTEKECLVEAEIYEEGSNGFNDTYNSCLIDHYNGRIEYYKNHKF